MCLAVGEALVGRFTPNNIHYMPPMGRQSFFESLDFAHLPTIALLMPLLSVTSLDLRHDYQRARLSAQQSQHIVAYYMSKSTTHPVVLPSRMVNANQRLLDAVRPRWSEYQPGPIHLDEETLFSTRELRALVATLGRHPEHCGNMATALHSRTVGGFVNSWEMTDDLYGIEAMPPRSDILYIVDEILFSSTYVDPRFRAPSPSDAPFINRVLAAIDRLRDLDRIMLSMELLVEELRRAISRFSRKRRVLWELKLVLVLMETFHRAFEAHGTTAHLKAMRALVGDFLSKNDPAEMPDFLLEALLTRASFRVDFRGAHLAERLHQLQERFERGFSLGGSLATRLLGWKKYLRLHISSPNELVVRGPMKLREILRWWCDYQYLAQALYQNPHFERPLLLRCPWDRQAEPTIIRKLPDLLAILNPIILRRVQAAHLLDPIRPAVAAPQKLPRSERLLCQGLARSIAADVLYNEALSPLFFHLDPSSPQEWPFLILNSPFPDEQPCQKILQRALYGEAHIDKFIPYAVLCPELSDGLAISREEARGRRGIRNVVSIFMDRLWSLFRAIRR